VRVLRQFTWSLSGAFLADVLSDTIIRGIYSARLWKMCQNVKFFGGTSIILNLGLAGASLMIFANLVQYGEFSEIDSISNLLYISLSITVFSDAFTAISLCYFLLRGRQSLPSGKTIDKIVAYTIETGALTSICAVVALITFSTMQTTFIYVCFQEILPKLYTNSMLAMLNSRDALRKELGSFKSSEPPRPSPIEVPERTTSLNNTSVSALLDPPATVAAFVAQYSPYTPYSPPSLCSSHLSSAGRASRQPGHIAVIRESVSDTLPPPIPPKPPMCHFLVTSDLDPANRV